MRLVFLCGELLTFQNLQSFSFFLLRFLMNEAQKPSNPVSFPNCSPQQDSVRCPVCSSSWSFITAVRPGGLESGVKTLSLSTLTSLRCTRAWSWSNPRVFKNNVVLFFACTSLTRTSFLLGCYAISM